MNEDERRIKRELRDWFRNEIPVTVSQVKDARARGNSLYADQLDEALRIYRERLVVLEAQLEAAP